VGSIQRNRLSEPSGRHQNGLFRYGQSTTSATNQGFFLLIGDGSTNPHSTFQIRFNQQSPVARNLNPNVDQTQIIQVGVWQHWEAVLALNTLGQSNGIFRMWVDGIRIIDYQNVVYITPGASNRFQAFLWNPTWGGQGAVRSRDDFISIDHLYLSGVP